MGHNYSQVPPSRYRHSSQVCSSWLFLIDFTVLLLLSFWNSCIHWCVFPIRNKNCILKIRSYRRYRHYTDFYTMDFRCVKKKACIVVFCGHYNGVKITYAYFRYVISPNCHNFLRRGLANREKGQFSQQAWLSQGWTSTCTVYNNTFVVHPGGNNWI